MDIIKQILDNQGNRVYPNTKEQAVFDANGASLDVNMANKADKSGTVSNVSYDTSSKSIKKTINGTTTNVVTSVQLSQLIRDEIKAQLSVITSGTPDVPVFDGNAMKYMALADYANIIGDKTFKIGGSSSSGELVSTFNKSGVWTIGNGTTRGFPEDNGVLAVFCAGSTAANVRFYLFYGLGLGNLYYASVWGGSTLQTAWTKLN